MRFLLLLIAVILVGAPLPATFAADSKSGTLSADVPSRVALLLSTSPTGPVQKRAYLVVNSQGLPDIYPSPRTNANTGKANNLGAMTVKELEEIWGPTSYENGVYTYQFAGYTGQWVWFKISVRGRDGLCEEYRVDGPNIDTQWLQTRNISDPDGTARNASGKLSLPPWIGCVDGTRDIHMCGFDVP